VLEAGGVVHPRLCTAREKEHPMRRRATMVKAMQAEGLEWGEGYSPLAGRH
jgi:hypothetical protein